LEAGRFPVVIFAPGASDNAWESPDLCEYLASHGYVVIASPSQGAATRNMTIDVAGMNAQAQDISFLIGYAQTLADTDAAKVAVVGHSWGGISNVAAASRDSRIGALVALDGSLRYYPSVIRDAGDIHPEQMTVPLLAFIQRNLSIEDLERAAPASDKPAPNVLNAWTHGDLMTIHMLGLAHSSFNTKSPRNDDVWWQMEHFGHLMLGDYDRADAIVGFSWVARYTLRFLDAYLKHDRDAQTFLRNTPARNGVPPHLMAAEFRAASGSPATFDTLRAGIGMRGFDHVEDVYSEMLKTSPDFKVDELRMADWAATLMGGQHTNEAVQISWLNIRMHPDSSGAYVSLGDVLRFAGNRQGAMDAYNKALALNSNNASAGVKLHRMSLP
jgi:dienelactone hydrolase